MIKGMGTDIVEIKRIERMISRYTNQFLNRILTENEIRQASQKSLSAINVSGRWAGKEAFYKAIPEEIQPHLSWKSIEIISDETGRPVINICDSVLKEKLDQNKINNFHISISHEREYCIAVVIIE